MAITPFKVIQGHQFGTNRNIVYDFLLVINTVYESLTVCKLSRIIGQVFAFYRGTSTHSFGVNP